MLFLVRFGSQIRQNRLIRQLICREFLSYVFLKILLHPVSVLVRSVSHHISTTKTMCLIVPNCTTSYCNVILPDHNHICPMYVTSITWGWWFHMRFGLIELRGLIIVGDKYPKFQYWKKFTKTVAHLKKCSKALTWFLLLPISFEASLWQESPFA